jgi:hypothetical protein
MFLLKIKTIGEVTSNQTFCTYKKKPKKKKRSFKKRKNGKVSQINSPFQISTFLIKSFNTYKKKQRKLSISVKENEKKRW